MREAHTRLCFTASDMVDLIQMYQIAADYCLPPRVQNPNEGASLKACTMSAATAAVVEQVCVRGRELLTSRPSTPWRGLNMPEIDIFQLEVNCVR